MQYYIIAALSFSVFISGIIGLIRFKGISVTFYPFIFCIWIACINEVLSFILITNGFSNYINSNFYVLIEGCLITWLFKNLRLFGKAEFLFYVIIASFIAAWILETFIFGKITGMSSYFRIVYSFAIVLMSITTINKLIVSTRKNIINNATFLLCIGFIIYFTYKVLVQAFWMYGLNSNHDFLVRVYYILIFINLFTNLIYALAVLWMPKRLGFILPL